MAKAKMRMACKMVRKGVSKCATGSTRDAAKRNLARGFHTFTLNANRSRKKHGSVSASKRARGNWLQRTFACKRGSKGKFVSCTKRRGVANGHANARVPYRASVAFRSDGVRVLPPPRVVGVSGLGGRRKRRL